MSRHHGLVERRDLLRAALARWEQRQVTIAGRRLRLRASLEEAVITLAPTVIVQLMAATDDPDVAEALERSTAAASTCRSRTFVALGATRADAEHRAHPPAASQDDVHLLLLS